MIELALATQRPFRELLELEPDVLATMVAVLEERS